MGNHPSSGMVPSPAAGSFAVSKEEPGTDQSQQLSLTEKTRHMSDSSFHPHPIDPEESVWAGVGEFRRKRRYSELLQTVTQNYEHSAEVPSSAKSDITQTSALKYNRVRHLSLQTDREQRTGDQQLERKRQRSFSLSTPLPGSSMMGMLRHRSLSTSEDEGSETSFMILDDSAFLEEDPFRDSGLDLHDTSTGGFNGSTDLLGHGESHTGNITIGGYLEDTIEKNCISDLPQMPSYSQLTFLAH